MKKHIVIIGAGPAGLACAWKILHTNSKEYIVTVLEKDTNVGGLAKTLLYKGYRFDVGGHRFYTKLPQVQKLYSSLLGKDMLTRKRVSRIYYNRQYYRYPLEAGDVLKKIGLEKAIKIGASYLMRQLNKHPHEHNFNEWVSNRFGDQLFTMFFKSYTEKVWGIPTEKLSATWAKQRIQNFSLPKAAINAITGRNPYKVKTIISEFLYPRLGPGMFYEKMMQDIIDKGGTIRLNHTVLKTETSRDTIKTVRTISSGKPHSHKVDYLVSTMPLPHLLMQLPVTNGKNPAKKLRFRSFLTVNLIVKNNPFPDNWIYIHDPDVQVGRIQNFFNWSPSMTRSRNTVPIGMEYFCDEQDSVWKTPDRSLIQHAVQEAEQIRLFQKHDVIDGFVHRVADAYPVYNIDYETPLAASKKLLSEFTNLYVAGRGGLFRYNNMDHSIQTGFDTAERILNPQAVHTPWPETNNNNYLETE